MTTEAREYIDFWIENSVHASEQYNNTGASQDVAVLVERLIDGAKGQGITKQAMNDEVRFDRLRQRQAGYGQPC